MSKLVRDGIPTLIGPGARTHIAGEGEYKAALAAKMVEEALEFQANPCLEELADVLEVVSATLKAHGWTTMEVTMVQTTKATERGKFDQRVILEDTSDPVV